MNDATNTEMIRLSDALAAANARVAELEARIAELQPMAECAAIMAVCGYFSRMRGPIGHLVRNALLGSEDFVRGEAYELDDCEIAVPLYAGSAPVPAAPSDGCDEALLDTMRELVDAEENLTEMAERKDAAYFERNQVVAALAKCFPSIVTQTDIPGWSHDWHGCVYIQLPTGQVSWHFHESQMYLLDGIPVKGAGWDGWDGHDTEEKYRRLNALPVPAAQPQPAAAPEAVAKDANDRLSLAYGYLWHVNNMRSGYDAPAGYNRPQLTPEKAAYKARALLREMLTNEQRGDGINRADAILSAAGTEGHKDE